MAQVNWLKKQMHYLALKRTDGQAKHILLNQKKRKMGNLFGEHLYLENIILTQKVLPIIAVI